MRSWESVVPEEDRLIYKKGEFGVKASFGQQPALLVIDVVQSFTGSKPQKVLDAIEEFRTSCGDVAWETLPRMKKVIEAARGGKIPIIYTKGDPVYKVFCGDSTKNDDIEAIRKMHSTPIAEQIAPIEGEFLVQKTKASAFFSTPLAVYLHRKRVDSLLVMGTSTSGCVRATVVDGFSHGFDVFVIEECCFDRSSFSHNVSLFDMNAKYATVVTMEETLNYIQLLT